ncbi:SIR2-family protein HDAC1 [Coccomyxa subellipsoidea C-169]|uniref:protein acetyllysine N-acetyltransferase n=1 Tax=Coccomyxa subellipsoidea (strain C-169) TaxID=574566 RepID=I0Z4E4_COCSC|nr:SIR2-family protein HDAC1 [Coccomyxa subellipsoidea C-169]EIE25513.1 SIR2-family protein HDAC1 [Coccomyxa subellipsoidea C-169]|eukprot:XP_005650057.1 SIR2-family protein HDAC1 [Coccomyxa subellipsoidea C-169]
MSLGYAEKLSFREDLGGQLGAPELLDDHDALQKSIEALSELVRESDNIIVFTGAGISTACGIPDFRGPQGVWTLQRAGKPLPKPKSSFTVARPSLTHMAIVGLMQRGKVRYVVSQNVDGLHLRSGVPRSKIAELHGNCFAERCPRCKKEYIRDFEIETVGFRQTGRTCSVEGCKGKLKDHILDWEDALPEDELTASEDAVSAADLAICLGTSLQITPACNLPLRTPKAGGKLVIINLQATPKDKKASLVIHGRADEVMRRVMANLAFPIPSYVREDSVTIGHVQEQPMGSGKGHPFNVRISSVHGENCAMPLVQTIDISFPDHPSLRPATLRSAPFQLRRTVAQPGSYPVSIQLHLVEGLDEPTVTLQYVAHILSQESFNDQLVIDTTSTQRKRKRQAVGHSITASFVTQEVDFHSSSSSADETHENGA